MCCRQKPNQWAVAETSEPGCCVVILVLLSRAAALPGYWLWEVLGTGGTSQGQSLERKFSQIGLILTSSLCHLHLGNVVFLAFLPYGKCQGSPPSHSLISSALYRGKRIPPFPVTRINTEFPLPVYFLLTAVKPSQEAVGRIWGVKCSSSHDSFKSENILYFCLVVEGKEKK